MAKFDSNGWRVDLEYLKNHIRHLILGGLTKEKIKALISKWVVYHQREKDKLIEFLEQTTNPKSAD